MRFFRLAAAVGSIVLLGLACAVDYDDGAAATAAPDAAADVLVVPSDASGDGSQDSKPADSGVEDAPPADYHARILADRPVSYFRFGGDVRPNAADELGHGTGKYYSGTTLGRPGAIANDPNTAVSLAGGELRVDIPSLDLSAANPWSIEVWVKRLGSEYEAFIEDRYDGGGEAGNTDGFVCLLSNAPYYDAGSHDASEERVACERYFDGGHTPGVFAPAPIGSYVHFVVMFDGTTITVYSNGVRTGYETSVERLGKAQTSLAFSGNVECDELAIYDRPLTEDEIRAHYRMGVGAK